MKNDKENMKDDKENNQDNGNVEDDTLVDVTEEEIGQELRRLDERLKQILRGPSTREFTDEEIAAAREFGKIMAKRAGEYMRALNNKYPKAGRYRGDTQ